MKRRPAIVVVLGVLTAIQAGIGLWRIVDLYLVSLRKGVLPFTPAIALLDEIGLCAAIAIAAWWWLPRSGRTWYGWAVHFIVMGWTLAIVQLTWVLLLGFFEHGVSWATLLVLMAVGTLVRQRTVSSGSVAEPATGGGLHPALAGAFIFWLLQAPQLFFRYHWTDTKDIWACRTVAFDATGGLAGIFDCLDPSRPPLQSILLWLGHTNDMIEGRLLPFLMIGAFGLILYQVFRKLAPALAPWGVLWFYMTVRVYQGAITSYADVPVMLAIAMAILLAVRDDLVTSRWRAIVGVLVAGAAATLIKRDGGGLVVVAAAVAWWFAPRRSDPRIYAAVLGVIIGYVMWSVRPSDLAAPSVFDFDIGTASAPALPLVPASWQEGVPEITPDTAKATLQTYVTMFYGMQGQMISHYGFGMFVPLWIILAVWLWRQHESLSPEGRRYSWIALAGWLAIIGIYVLHVSTGHAYRGSLRIIRTAFGRHLVHTYVFALLSAVAMAEVLVARARSRSA